MMSMACLITLCLFASPPATPGTSSGTTLRDELGREFRAYHSRNFEILSDADPGVVHKVEGLAEDTHRAVTKWNSAHASGSSPSAQTLTIVLFRREAEFTRFLKANGLEPRADVPGYYDERRAFCVILDIAGMEAIRRKKDELFVARREMSAFTQDPGSKASTARQHRLEQIQSVESQIAEYERAINSTVIRHEIAHMVLAHLGLQRREDLQRRWLKEGLAMQFENPDGMNTFRMADFQSIPNGNQKELIRNLIENAATVGPGAEQPARAYAAAWALVLFLSQTRGELFQQYVLNDSDTSLGTELDHFEKRFGEIDDEFIKKLNEYLRNLSS